MSLLGNPVALLGALLLRVPLILRTAILRSINQSPGSGKQDLRTEMTVTIIRSFVGRRVPVSKQQKGAMRDPGIKGPLWVSKITIPQPEVDVQDAVIKAIEALKVGSETYDIPGVVPVEAEWTGYRRGVDKNALQPEISEEEKYQELKKENDADMVVLYFHGGAYYLMDPCTHRPATSQISKHTKSPVLSVRYRLAPQHPFPAALVDALTAYLYLIAPPPGSLHAPIPPNKIILSGDSAGGNLALVLLQTLLTLHRTSTTVTFHGQSVPITPPGGAAVSSPWCDISRAMPSITTNAIYDFLPPPRPTPSQANGTPYRPPPVPDDEIWPASPPRADYFVNASSTIHPLVSPLATPSHLWKDSPPIFISVGEEGLTDEGLITARRMHNASVPVVAEQTEGMPHCFGLMMPGHHAGKAFYDSMGAFCRDTVAGNLGDRADGKLRFIAFNPDNNKSIPLESVVSHVSEEKVDALLNQAKEWRVEGEALLRKQWSTSAKNSDRARL
ncbi:Alpha/Beta hydrolase protein [Aspergillus undulatus]|uniref:Alpha/Beta hydrolase protein n=1 Tax=Aspergillus undulatus TaxID=1810928 RepID=UPI003CCE1CF6